MNCTDLFASCLNTFVLNRHISCTMRIVTYTIYDLYITMPQISFSREASSAFTKNNNLSKKIASSAYLAAMDHWFSKEISCVVSISTRTFQPAMDF